MWTRNGRVWVRMDILTLIQKDSGRYHVNDGDIEWEAGALRINGCPIVAEDLRATMKVEEYDIRILDGAIEVRAEY